MTKMGLWVVLVCVLIMMTGQLLFKQVAINFNRVGSLFDISVLGLLTFAGLLYLGSTGLWIWALRFNDISKAYPLFALGFVFVPIAGIVFFNESFTLRYFLGIAFIVVGVYLTSASS